MDEALPYNHPLHKDKRRFLRNNPTKAEKMLWEKLKGKALNGLKFRRQYGVGRYVVDFYCPKLRLAIELDGNSHLEEGAQDYDRQREDYIQSFDIYFLRFTNDQVYKNLNEVIEKIEKTAAQLEEKSPPK